MPIPKPRKGEERQEFISRCISRLHDLDPDRPQKQIIAICYDSWRRNKGKRTEESVPTDNLPSRCICRKCGYVIENPKKHCMELKCPKCGGPMRRRKRPIAAETISSIVEWAEARRKKKKKTKNKGKIPKKEVTTRKRKTKTGGTYNYYPSGRGHSFVPKDFSNTNKTLKKSDVKGTVPSWVAMARRLMKSKKASQKLKDYWRKRLETWEKKNGK